MFVPNNDKSLKPEDEIYNYIIIDVVDNEGNYLQKNIALNRFYSTNLIENLSGERSYYVIIKGGICKFGFFMELYSEKHSIENMTYFNFLKELYGYQIVSFNQQNPIIDARTFYLLARYNIIACGEEQTEQETIEGKNIALISNKKIADNATNFAANEEDLCGNKEETPAGDLEILFNFKYPVKYVKNYIKIFISPKDTKDEESKEMGKEVFPKEKIYLSEGNYTVAVYVDHSEYALKASSFDMEIAYSNNRYKIDQVENIDPYFVTDYYTPNLHNIVFKELIYASDKIQASLYVSLKDTTNAQQNTELSPPSIIKSSSQIGKFESTKVVKNRKSTRNIEKLSNQIRDESGESAEKDANYGGDVSKIKLIFELYQLVL